MEMMLARRENDCSSSRKHPKIPSIRRSDELMVSHGGSQCLKDANGHSRYREKEKKNLNFVSDGAIFLHVVVTVTWLQLCL